ncbi:ABC transporter related [Beutenbergia cavernae DSM 12333]|uniref:ABC transporter related n=1 Tax=Beutenbergia cavernae (strain ATCC BAA-8 / DSM 12333 / CCUG 43141 / JCM 11478 / NBRC 16432 / NCIMB 13614 / HKI 0122) TaxID=471853 RepID=C5C1H6_BEUC1|nr:ABC transporter ATP-binding protein [Beutenbergia cavernae]ACQ81586.1 ABC transporter related [Beutenbergia cavernae DSM 12333]
MSRASRTARIRLDENAPLLDVAGLRTGFRRADGDEFIAVDGVTFTLRQGRALAIVGESGSGKSVTVRSLLRLLPRTGRILDGQARFGGTDLVGASDRTLRTIRGREVGMVFQNAMEALNPTIPVGRQLAEALTWHRLCSRSEARERAVATLGDVGIPDPERRARMYPFQLSGGMRQRAMIAMAIIAGPRLVVADEPTTALDVTVQAQVLDLLAEIKDSGTGMIMVTHDLGVARRFCDDVLVMNQGKVVESGTISEVLDAPREPYTQMLLDATLEVGDVARAPDGSATAPPRLVTASAPQVASDDDAPSPTPMAASLVTPAAASDDASAPIVVAEHLDKTFHSRGGDTHAVRDVSLTIERGRTLGLVGESGSGKSTVARLVMGLYEPDSGRVLLDGHDLHDETSNAQRRRMQMVFQNPYGSLLPHYTAGANITESLRLQDIGTPAERTERAAELLRLVGLSPDDARRYPQQFSGGQQQRIAIARALAPEPEVLVCDEPTSALDVSIQAQILDLLSEIQERLGVAYLLISHNLAVVERMSDEVAVMKDGAIVERGDRRAIFATPQHPYTHQLLDAILPVRGVGATSAAFA